MPALVAGFLYSSKGFSATGNSKSDSVLTTLSYSATEVFLAHTGAIQIRLLLLLLLLFDQEMGVPQGSILSDTLFGLKINSIVKAISPGVECSLYVDDFLICYWSKYINISERHIQCCLNKLSVWADTNGFKLTVCMHF